VKKEREREENVKHIRMYRPSFLPPSHSEYHTHTHAHTHRKVLGLADKGPFWTQVFQPDYGVCVCVCVCVHVHVSFFFSPGLLLLFSFCSLTHTHTLSLTHTLTHTHTRTHSLLHTHTHPDICQQGWWTNLLYINNFKTFTNNLGQVCVRVCVCFLFFF
jgi:hypothetical protein